MFTFIIKAAELAGAITVITIAVEKIFSWTETQET